jgi:acetyltransferase-like isoleucine patch superfamily enzyme
MTADPISSLTAIRLPPLFAALPPDFADRYDPEAPWALLGDPLDAVLAALPSERFEVRITPDVHLMGDRIAIGKGTRLGPGAVIEGPAAIGRDVDIRPGAFIRGGAWIGDGCVVGASTEIKRSILFPGAHAPHLNYVGDSILGTGVNLGAGTILSNFRHDGGEVKIPAGPPGAAAAPPISTGRRKLSAILGEGVKTGCNCVLNPGVVVGRDTRIYAGVTLRPGVYPEGSIIKLRQEIEIAPALTLPKKPSRQTSLPGSVAAAVERADRLMTMAQVAELAGVSKVAVQKAVEKGRLVPAFAVRFDSSSARQRPLFLPAEVDAWLVRRRARASAGRTP